MELGASSSSSVPAGYLGGRAIDRHNPIIADSERIITPTMTPAPTTSRLSRRHGLQKGKDKFKGVSRADQDDDDEKKKEKSQMKQKGVVSKGCNNDFDGITPPKHLLADIVPFNDENAAFTPVSPDSTCINFSNEDHELKLAGSKFSSFPTKAGSDQVVVLSVSLHCRGCARKVQKHLSKMEGVRSFNIDFAAQKVTVIGDVTPMSILGNISKVKNAQLWPFPSPLPS